MSPDAYAAMASNIMQLTTIRGLGPYELSFYRQLLMTLQKRARLDELIIHSKIEEKQNGERTNQTPGGTSSQASESPEHRGDDPPPSV